MQITDIIGSHRLTFTTGQVTTIAAGDATAGHILALRPAASDRSIRLRSFEPEFFLSTAFGAAQEVGFDAVIARKYTVAHTGATALTMTGGRALAGYPNTVLAGRIADTGALSSGTHTLDANPIAKGSQYCSAIGQSLVPRLYDFTSMPLGGIILGSDEGLVVRNLVLMGATGVGRWYFTIEFDDVIVR
jgi:hypothetical protein